MKRINQVLLFVFVFSLVSCNNSEIFESSKEQTELRNENGFTVIDNVIHFNNEESFIETKKFLNGLSEDDRLAWEAAHNFISNKTLAYEGYDLLLEASDNLEFEEILMNYSNVLYLSGDEVLQYVDGSGLSSICSPNGNYFIGSLAYKITPEFELVSRSGDLGMLEKAAQNIGDASKDIISQPRNRIQYLKSIDCSSTFWSGSKVYDHPQLTDRQVIVEVTTSFNGGLYSGTDYYKGNYRQTVKTISRKKNLGVWMKYNTQHSIRDFKVGLMTPNISNATYLPNDYAPGYIPSFSVHYENIPYSYTSNDVKEKIWVENEQVGYAIYYYYPIGARPYNQYPPHINSISGKVWIRGFENEGNAYVIDENSCN
ncbi:MAG: hypothetical protein JXP36_15440 [Bacteroidales bacterium]|nr:hypothetical protein [Bacteroidales bacterium]